MITVESRPQTKRSQDPISEKKPITKKDWENCLRGRTQVKALEFKTQCRQKKKKRKQKKAEDVAQWYCNCLAYLRPLDLLPSTPGRWEERKDKGEREDPDTDSSCLQY
jgi:hypothetical protein